MRVSERGGDVAFDRKLPYSVSSKSERERLTRAGLLRDVVHLDGAPAPARRERTMENLVGAIERRARAEPGRVRFVLLVIVAVAIVEGVVWMVVSLLGWC